MVLWNAPDEYTLFGALYHHTCLRLQGAFSLPFDKLRIPAAWYFSSFV